jgi:hypothetical protein
MISRFLSGFDDIYSAHAPFHRDPVAVAQLYNLFGLSAILNALGEVRQKILDRVDAKLLEEPFALRAHPLGEAHRGPHP